MSKAAGTSVPVDIRFRPESLSHFKEVAKNLAWLLARPLQKCQEDLARIYGYSGLHELQQVLKNPGVPGPFDALYTTPVHDKVAENRIRRVFLTLFGVPQKYWRDDFRATEDRCYLAFEMGLFQEAAEHRSRFEKIREVLTDGGSQNKWPLIEGLPLGLRSWQVSRYFEPLELVNNWRNALPASKYFPAEFADIRWQRWITGTARLSTMFRRLAPRVGGRKPAGMGKFNFSHLEDHGDGVAAPSWEWDYFSEWLSAKASLVEDISPDNSSKMIQEFIARPSRATAASCPFVNKLKDPVGFRDRWAFESYKGVLGTEYIDDKALFSSSLKDGVVHSVLLHMDQEDEQSNDMSCCQLWQFHCTENEPLEKTRPDQFALLQPRIHANGTLVVPYSNELVGMSTADWYISHDNSDFASEAAALACQRLYMPAIGVKHLDTINSIIEIDELLIAAHVTVEALQAYFIRLLRSFDNNCFPDSYGYWSHTLSLTSKDMEENTKRDEYAEFADYVPTPRALLINIEGSGQIYISVTREDGKPVRATRKSSNKETKLQRQALAALVLEAVNGLPIDVVIYDSTMDLLEAGYSGL